MHAKSRVFFLFFEEICVLCCGDKGEFAVEFQIDASTLLLYELTIYLFFLIVIEAW